MTLYAEPRMGSAQPLAPLNTTREAADYLAVSVPTLNRWRMHGTGPQFVRLGSAVRYTRESLEAFVRESVAEAG